MSKNQGFFLILFLAASVLCIDDNARISKIFPLFSIVRFKNGECTSSDPDTPKGICYTSTECHQKSGRVQGNCAAGFGVCCIFVLQQGSATVTENNTYIRSTGFPGSYDTSNGLSLTYAVQKCAEDICAIRLDFETFTTVGPTVTTEDADSNSAAKCTDSFVVQATGSGLSSPVICGKNTGQHIYMDLGNQAGHTATLSFTFGTTSSTARTWDIKVSQLQCNTIYTPPSGCLQWLTGLTGSFQTFNFLEDTTTAHLPSQSYSICIRQEANHCCVQYFQCANTANAFTIGNTAAVTVDGSCTEDYIGIEGVMEACNYQLTQAMLFDSFCGYFSVSPGSSTVEHTSVCDCSAPFTVYVYTDDTTDSTQVANRGVCLDYRQVPCSS